MMVWGYADSETEVTLGRQKENKVETNYPDRSEMG